MPLHEWKRVNAGIFHDFHHAWIEEIKRSLNRGLLPPLGINRENQSHLIL